MCLDCRESPTIGRSVDLRPPALPCVFERSPASPLRDEVLWYAILYRCQATLARCPTKRLTAFTETFAGPRLRAVSGRFLSRGRLRKAPDLRACPVFLYNEDVLITEIVALISLAISQ